MKIKIRKIKAKYLLIFILITFLFIGALHHFLVERRFAKSLEKRTLLIVMENNFMLLPEIEEDYEEHKNLVDTLFSYIFKVDKKDLNNKSLPEIVDIYGEDYLANRFKNVAKDYGKIVVLSDEKASYDNFKRVLIDLDNEGKTIDILLDLHGGSDNIYFYNQEISKHSIGYDKDFSFSQKSLNIGYVYQTICYGGENMEIWLKLGAKVVNGSKGINNFVILAPERFLYLWTHGKTYYDAVNSGFNLEVLIQKTIGKFLPETIFLIKEDYLELGRMIFIGEKDYKLE